MHVRQGFGVHEVPTSGPWQAFNTSSISWWDPTLTNLKGPFLLKMNHTRLTTTLYCFQINAKNSL